MIIIDQACVSLYQRERVFPLVITFFSYLPEQRPIERGFSQSGINAARKPYTKFDLQVLNRQKIQISSVISGGGCVRLGRVSVWMIGWAMGIRGEATSQVQKGSKMPVVARVNHTPTPQLDIKF